jgi:hypothetical protein
VANLIEVELGSEGIGYIEHCLRQGTGLSRKMLGLPLASGRAFAPLPQHTSLDRAKSFAAGGLLSWHDTVEWLTDHLRRLWREDPNGTLVFQDVWGGRRSDLAVQRKASAKFFDADNVYYYAQASGETIETVIRDTSSFLLIGIFTHSSIDTDKLAKRGMVGTNLINKLVQTTEEILVTAYDREGFVLWRQ